MLQLVVCLLTPGCLVATGATVAAGYAVHVMPSRLRMLYHSRRVSHGTLRGAAVAAVTWWLLSQAVIQFDPSARSQQESSCHLMAGIE
jgi:hypothetical protein